MAKISNLYFLILIYLFKKFNNKIKPLGLKGDHDIVIVDPLEKKCSFLSPPKVKTRIRTGKIDDTIAQIRDYEWEIFIKNVTPEIFTRDESRVFIQENFDCF